MIAGSPGVGGMSNSSSSSSGASWRSGTPSPPLSEEGVPTRSSPCPASSHPSHNQPHYPYNASGSSSSSTPGSTTLDEGIVPDYIEEQHPRKKVSNLFQCSFTLFLSGTTALASTALSFYNFRQYGKYSLLNVLIYSAEFPKFPTNYWRKFLRAIERTISTSRI